MSSLSLPALLIPLLLLWTSQPYGAIGELSTDPVDLAVELGHDAEITCAWGGDENATKVAAITWYRIRVLPNNAAATVSDLLTNSSRVEVADGVLTIHNVTFPDAGRYECRDDTDAPPVEAELIVYEDSNYWTEWGVVNGVAVALLLLLALGLVLQNRRTMRIRREREAELKASRRKYINLTAEKETS